MRTAAKHPRRIASCVLLLTVAVLVSCAPRSAAAGYDRDVITSDELAAMQHRTLSQIIQRLRPQWVTRRPTPDLVNNEPPPTAVYLDGSRMSEEMLDRMVGAEVFRMQFLKPVDATQRYGVGHSSGAILITARRPDGG